MPDWTAFAGVAGVVLALLLVLARLSTAHVLGSVESGDPSRRGPGGTDTGTRPDAEATEDGAPGADFSPQEWDWGVDGTADTDDPADGPPRPRNGPAHPGDDQTYDVADLPSSALLANVALSQGLFGSLLVLAAWWAEIPPASLGLGPLVTPDLIGLGVALGLALWVANEFAGRAGARFGVDGGEELRSLLAPDTPAGWLLLLGAVLPLVALFEEFLFRSVLIGALGAGFGLPPSALVVGSSVAFALGHGAQGRTGMLVTGALGLVLGAAFVATGSFLVVAVAHYLVNALEFVVHEGLVRD